MGFFRVLLGKIIATAAWKWFAKNILGHLTFRIMSYPSFPMRDYFKIIGYMKRFESRHSIFCFASTDHASAASVLIRTVSGSGMFSHAGVLLPDHDEAFHMLGEGPVSWHTLELLRTIDYLAVIEVRLDRDKYEKARKRIDYIRSHPREFFYDYAQDMENTKTNLYCSEMVYVVLDGLVDDPDFKARRILDRKVFDPDQVTKIGNVVYTNHPDLAKITKNLV